MKLKDIKPNPDNPRVIKDASFTKLCNSIKDFPKMMALRPIVVDANGMVLGGNMRLKALQHIGMNEIPDEWVKCADDLTEDECKRFIIADNVSGGEWDWDMLANEWDAVQLDEWGLDIPTEWGLLKDVIEDDYAIPDDIETDIVLGDILQIGEHRLMCGDSTDSDAVAKLMNGQVADMVFTDPPYEIENSDIYCGINLVSKNTNILIFASDKQIPYIFEAKLGDFKRLYVLDTNIASPTNNDVYINHIALLRFKTGEPCKFNNIHNGGRSITKMDYRKNLKEEKLHDHQKSQVILGLFTQYWSNEENIIVYLFGGSGSIMVVSEQLKRRCYVMELDAKNCQIILDRMKKCYNLDASKLNK